jgi:CYTH domain-containing protein
MLCVAALSYACYCAPQIVRYDYCMIEVEIRGALTQARYDALKILMTEKGKHVETLDRQMVLLKDVPGYFANPNERINDVRIRVTNGECAIMIKRKLAENNVGRSEWSVPLPGQTLESAQAFVAALGCTHGQWMHRIKHEYEYEGSLWSLVEAVPGIFYFEVEQSVLEVGSIESTRTSLVAEAHKLDLIVFSPAESKAFIEHLGVTVNKHIEW